LLDVSVSRAGQSWGIPLPFDPASVIYVWFDALINYASAVGLGSDPAMFETWWPADLHVVGKDITRFHAVIWPAMLMSAKLPLPRQVFGHGFITIAGQRMSKTLGTIIDPVVAAERVGVDPLRLYLVKEIPFGGDGDFSFERLDERYNADLANNLGNLVSRVTAMAARYRGGALRPGAGAAGGPSALTRVAEEAIADYRESMDALMLHEGAAAAFGVIDATNEFIATNEPWTMARDPAAADRLTQVLFDAAEAIRLAGVMLAPMMPASSREVLRRVGAPSEGLLLDRDCRWQHQGERMLRQGAPLWPRKETIQVSDNPLPPDAPAPGARPPGASTTSAGPAAPSPSADDRISIDDFMRVELRTAKVLAAERVPKSNKLLKLNVDTGAGERTLVAGIAEAYEPDQLVGKTVVVVFNLKPAKLMGIESNGMVLAASPDGGRPEVVTFEHPPAPGTRVR
jgi:methionyl-tRNA synthetase